MDTIIAVMNCNQLTTYKGWLTQRLVLAMIKTLKIAFIKATGIFHVCPMLPGVQAGPIHIPVRGNKGEPGTVICEQIKAILSTIDSWFNLL